MFKKHHFFFLFLISFSCFSQNTAIPDPYFEQALIDLGIDNIIDGQVVTANISNITSLDVSGRNISNLTGVESFTNLEGLFCQDNQITTLNISNNLDLQQVWCDNNLLSSLDTSQNSELLSITCSNNQIISLDVSNNTKLNVLVCDNNLISTINLISNNTLNRLQCAGNLLTNLNISQNRDLTILHCYSNQITTLDLSLNNDLIELNCSDNFLTELDLSSNSQLTIINSSFNNLCALNLKNGNNNDITDLNFVSNPDLTCVIVDSPNSINSNWQPISFTNYVSSAEECSNQILVDELDNFVGISFSLPSLINGMYYTESGGNGTQLFPGQVILTSQTIYIYNSVNDCYFNESSFNITIFSGEYLIPKFFTPNNDNYNDTWIVYDSTGMFTSINIFDRYGKLLKTLLPDNFEWDGRFKGSLMETNDYWFVINRDTNVPLKGHFTLKR